MINTGISAFRKPLHCIFEPEPDITAYELAMVLKCAVNRILYEDEWDALPEWKRHIRRLDTHPL